MFEVSAISSHARKHSPTTNDLLKLSSRRANPTARSIPVRRSIFFNDTSKPWRLRKSCTIVVNFFLLHTCIVNILVDICSKVRRDKSTVCTNIIIHVILQCHSKPGLVGRICSHLLSEHCLKYFDAIAYLLIIGVWTYQAFKHRSERYYRLF